MEIRWRPSGGRGEYEYPSSFAHLKGKQIVVEVPHLGTRISTDVRFDFKDGKRRFRRDDRNDRTRMNVPPLVAAIAALPEPKREVKGPLVHPLVPGSYVVGTVLAEIVEETPKSVVLLPKAIKPRDASDFIDIESRLASILGASGSNNVIDHFAKQLALGVNSRALVEAANAAHALYPYSPGGASAVSAETDDIVADYVGKEGAARIRIHRYKERDPKVVAKAKALFKKKHGFLFCQCCGISFSRCYAPIVEDFIEAHHVVPLESVKEEVATSPGDLVMLCPNCHRMVHKTKSCSLKEVQEAIASNGFAIGPENLELLKSV